MRMEVGKAMDQIMLMSGTIENFRHFLQNDKVEQTFSVNDIVNRTIDFVSESLSFSNITVCFEAESTVTAVGLPNEYSQVLLNILGNARDILKERQVEDPQIVIRLSSENELAVVTAIDNGGGIDEEILPLIFDPYFSTKDPGKGSGIGLYISKVMIEQNMNGRLIARNLDEGAEFRIELRQCLDQKQG